MELDVIVPRLDESVFRHAMSQPALASDRSRPSQLRSGTESVDDQSLVVPVGEELWRKQTSRTRRDSGCAVEPLSALDEALQELLAEWDQW